MAKIFYEVGLTDEPHSGMQLNKNDYEKPIIHYNLIKMQPSVEKSKLVWEFYDTPVVRAILDSWEKIIRAPFVLTCSYKEHPNHHLPDEIDMRLSWEYVRLLPPDVNTYVLTKQDAEHIVTHHQRFGELYIPSDMLARVHDKGFQGSWIQVCSQKLDPDLLYEKGPVELKPLCGFFAKFHLERPMEPITRIMPHDIEWFEKYKEKLDELGYDPQDPRNRLGDYPIAKLLTDPLEAFETLKQYPYMCRHSVISEDMHGKKD